VAIDLSQTRLIAVALTTKKDRVHVGNHISVPLPSDVDPLDDEWVGRWIGRTLSEAGLGRGPLVYVVPRVVVSMKRFRLPSVETDELPGMVRLKLLNQLPFEQDDTQIDYAIIQQRQGETEVIAVALRTSIIDRYTALAKAARRKIERIAFRPLATAALIAEHTEGVSGAILAVDIRDHHEIEVAVEWDGGLRFARGIDISSGVLSSQSVLEIDSEREGVIPDDALSASDTDEESITGLDALPEVSRNHANNIAREVHRSWMSYRVTEDAPEIQRVIIIGTDGLTGGVAEAVRHDLGKSTEVFLSRSKVTGNTDELGHAWSLVGAALEHFEGRDPIDFLNPKSPPNTVKRKRIRWVGVAAAVVIVCGLGWSIARKDLDNLKKRNQIAQQQCYDAAPADWDYQRERLRIEHLDRWESTSFDWLAHMQRMWEVIPSSDQAILNGFSVSMSKPRIQRIKGRSKWAMVEVAASFRFQGAAKNRSVADAIRSAFVDDPVYNTEPVSSDISGTDGKYPETFSLRLITYRTIPVVLTTNIPESATIESGGESEDTNLSIHTQDQPHFGNQSDDTKTGDSIESDNGGGA